MSYWSLVSLVLANLVPVFGVLYWEWSVVAVVLLYWGENIVVGFLNIFKILIAQGKADLKSRAYKAWKFDKPVSKTYVMVNYLFGFVMFAIGHFLAVMFVIVSRDTAFVDKLVSDFYGYCYEFLGLLLVFFVSHMISFFANYICRQEYKVRCPLNQMQSWFDRVVTLHLFVMVVGFGLSFGYEFVSQIVLVGILMVLKTFFDLLKHWQEHKV